MKYIVVTGGVVSGLGKGITISSIGRILKASGARVTSIKIDPYLNVDAGTMSPYEHGETFVLDDGGETDLDLGNYERFLDITLTAKHNITSGKVYKEVIRQERRGDYLGKTVQIVPHATDMVQSWLREVAKVSVDGTGLSPDICLIEVGGTVGDIESMVFLEALRQFQFLVGRENILFVHVSLVPVLGSVGEQKTKPTQHSVKELRALGLSPDVIVCRSTELLSDSTKNKISTFCHVHPSHIISVHDVSNIYHVPLILQQQGVHTIIRELLQLQEVLKPEPDLSSWSKMAHGVDNLTEKVKIALVGKYVGLQDSYLSVIKALKHSAILIEKDVEILWIEASDLEDETKKEEEDKYTEAWRILKTAQGVLVPGGFGVRGVPGMIEAARYARENKIPYLGVCLGMQVMVIEYARHVLGLEGAHSTEFNEGTKHPVVMFMPEINQKEMGGTMRLGARATVIRGRLPDQSQSIVSEAYGYQGEGSSECSLELPVKVRKSEVEPDAWSILERHRHRYEVNPVHVTALETAGLIFSGKDETNVRMEVAEMSRKEHPFYFGAQFHPEFKSRPERPSPPFFGFLVMAAATKVKISTQDEKEQISVIVGEKTKKLNEAGLLWRAYEAAIRREIAFFMSPASGKYKRQASPINEGSSSGKKKRSGSLGENFLDAAGGTPGKSTSAPFFQEEKGL